jgi:putative ABC transport system ATP-binding protein
LSSDGENIVVASGIEKSFGRGSGRIHVLRGLDLTVRKGEFLAVMGPSGCGKTTLLHVLGLVTPQDAGGVFLNDRQVPMTEAARNALRRKHIGLVFQRFNLINVLSAADNVAIWLRVRGLPADGRVQPLLEAVGIPHLARRKPSQMSVGEQQRVAVARAVAHDPDLLLADEPTGSLDSGNATALLELLRNLNRQRGQSIVMITHSPEAAAFADRVVHMKDGRLLP